MLYEAPLSDVADDLRRGRTEPAAYVRTLAARAAAVDTEIRAFVSASAEDAAATGAAEAAEAAEVAEATEAGSDGWERAREAAAGLPAAYPEAAARPPLYGVPVGVKDIFHVDGFETRAGSALPPEALSGAQATAVSRLTAAGAVVPGKTVTTEFAYFEPGPTRNPHDTGHTPGGSSSGSAAAVAAGLCPLALGTQTIGSVVRPAAFCGVVGVKPTYGRIPTDGVLPVSPSVDTIGYFTQDLAGARLAAAVLCDDWRSLPTPRERPTLGVPEGPYLDQATETGRRAFETHVDRLAAAGYDVERVSLFRDLAAINGRHDDLVAGEMALAHAEWYDEYAERYAEPTRELIERGRETSTGAVARGRRGRSTLRDAVDARMNDRGVDVWVAPAAPGPAPSGLGDTGDPAMNLPWTHAGLPAVSLPGGTTEAGLPLGLQCVARFGADEDLLLWAEGLADALPDCREPIV